MTAAQYAPHIETAGTHESPTIQSYFSHSISRSLSLPLDRSQTDKQACTHTRTKVHTMACKCNHHLVKEKKKEKKGQDCYVDETV